MLRPARLRQYWAYLAHPRTVSKDRLDDAAASALLRGDLEQLLVLVAAAEVEAMWVRMGSFRVVPGKLDELRRVYLQECVPIVKAADGNLDCCLLESATDADAVIAWTVWQTEQHAAHYEMSGTAQAVVARVRHLFAGAPVLQSFRIRREV